MTQYCTQPIQKETIMATIREISERTGVSIATVSKVLNEKHGVNAETRQLVMDAARELNYRPNLNARYLKSGRSQTLGIVTEDLTVFNAPEIVDGSVPRRQWIRIGVLFGIFAAAAAVVATMAGSSP